MKAKGFLGSNIRLRPENLRAEISRRITLQVWQSIGAAILAYEITIIIIVGLVSIVIEVGVAWPQIIATSLVSILALPVLAFASPFWALHRILLGLFDPAVEWIDGVSVLVIMAVTFAFVWFLARTDQPLYLRIYLSLLFCLSSGILIGWIAGA